MYGYTIAKVMGYFFWLVHAEQVTVQTKSANPDMYTSSLIVTVHWDPEGASKTPRPLPSSAHT